MSKYRQRLAATALLVCSLGLLTPWAVSADEPGRGITAELVEEAARVDRFIGDNEGELASLGRSRCQDIDASGKAPVD